MARSTKTLACYRVVLSDVFLPVRDFPLYPASDFPPTAEGQRAARLAADKAQESYGAGYHVEAVQRGANYSFLTE